MVPFHPYPKTHVRIGFGLKLGSSYAKEKIPVSLTSEPITIFINVSLIAFPIISTKDTKFSTDFYLNIRWYDLRLDMWDLDHDFFKNSLSKEELDALWKPKLAFVNSLSQLYSIQPSIGILIKESDPLAEDISLATEGKKNVVTICIIISIVPLIYNLLSIYVSWKRKFNLCHSTLH